MHIEHETRPVNRIAQAIALSIVIAALSACSVSSGIGSIDTQEEIVTRSVTKPAETEGIGAVDAEIIKAAVADADDTQLLAWQNPSNCSPLDGDWDYGVASQAYFDGV